MADKFINGTGLGAIKTWIATLLGGKQDTLVSGTNIKTINGGSLLGSGNVSLDLDAKLDADGSNADDNSFSIESGNIVISGGSDGVVSISNVKTPTANDHAANKKYVDDAIANELEAFEHQDYKMVDVLPVTGESGVRYLLKIVDNPDPPEEFHMEEYMYIEGQWRDCGRFDTVKEATDTVAGTIKLNPTESVGLNANGQLTVGGRIGQYPDGGVFYPTNIEPSGVGTSSFLMTDGAKGVAVSQRTFAIMAGVNITCRSAAANSTQYRVVNSYANRFMCYAVRNGRAALIRQMP